MATHSNILAWRVPGTGEPGGLPSMGSHRVGHDWSDLAAAAAMMRPSFQLRSATAGSSACPQTPCELCRPSHLCWMPYSSSSPLSRVLVHLKGQLKPSSVWASRLCFPQLLPSTHSVQFSSVSQSCPTLRPHGLQHARPPCPSPAPGVYSNSCPLSRWCHPTISSSVISFSSCLKSIPAESVGFLCVL